MSAVPSKAPIKSEFACPWCNGTGRTPKEWRGRESTFEPCPGCKATGDFRNAPPHYGVYVNGKRFVLPVIGRAR